MKNSQSSLNSLISQTAQVGAGLGVILLITGGNPSPEILGLTTVVGVAFVAYTEKKRLTKEYNKLRAKQKEQENDSHD